MTRIWLGLGAAVVVAATLAAAPPKPKKPTRLFVSPTDMEFLVCTRTDVGVTCRPAALVASYLQRNGDESCP